MHILSLLHQNNKQSMKAKSSSGSEHIKSGHSTSNGNKKRSLDNAKSRTIPSHLLKRISNEILDHSKQLGLFDELRLKLLAHIELSKEFYRVRSDFREEVESFCSTVDLTLPRAKLREKLNIRTLYKSARRLEDYVQQVSRQHRSEFKQLYNQHAIEYLKRNQTNAERDDHLPT